MGGVKMKFGTSALVKDYPWYRDVWLPAAVAADFDSVGTGDSQSLWGDPFVTMTTAALRTNKLGIRVGVINPVTRHPAVVASAMVGLQQLSEGRASLAVATGDSAVRNIHEPPATFAQLEEYCRALKGLWAGETVPYRGREIQLHWGVPIHVPLFMTPSGPKTLRLAGQIADGVTLMQALTPEALDNWLGYIRAGAAEAGRSMDQIEISCVAATCIAETEAAGIQTLRFQLAGAANHVYRFHMEGKGVPEELKPRIHELQRRYDSRHHASWETSQGNAALVDELGLTDWLARRSAVAGPPERIIERIREIAAMGVTSLGISQMVADPLAFMRAFGEQIIPAFR